MPQKQDYLLRLLEELGRFLQEIRHLRVAGHGDAALLTVLQAQERLFARPAREFLSRPLDEQLHLLVVGEQPADARAKCLAYAELLTEAARVYAAREQTALAVGAAQLALTILLDVRERQPDADPEPLRLLALPLLSLLPEDELAAEARVRLGLSAPG